MYYPYFIIPIIAGCITQATKFLLSIVKHNKVEIKYLLTSGHMPSSHTAFVVSLTTMVGIKEGVYSMLFAITFVFSYIVIYDAMFIRTNIGHNGKVMNDLIREISGIKKENYPILRERVGHRPLEVLVGGVMGAAITSILMLILENI